MVAMDLLLKEFCISNMILFQFAETNPQAVYLSDPHNQSQCYFSSCMLVLSLSCKLVTLTTSLIKTFWYAMFSCLLIDLQQGH